MSTSNSSDLSDDSHVEVFVGAERSSLSIPRATLEEYPGLWNKTTRNEETWAYELKLKAYDLSICTAFDVWARGEGLVPPDDVDLRQVAADSFPGTCWYDKMARFAHEHNIETLLKTLCTAYCLALGSDQLWTFPLILEPVGPVSVNTPYETTQARVKILQDLLRTYHDQHEISKLHQRVYAFVADKIIENHDLYEYRALCINNFVLVGSIIGQANKLYERASGKRFRA